MRYIISGMYTGKSFGHSLTESLTRMSAAVSLGELSESGIWQDQTRGVGFSYQELVQSECRRYVLVFNGAIYNHQELRKDIEQVRNTSIKWPGGGASAQIVLQAIRLWGLEKTLLAIKGMFTLALWDSETGLLTLARDRFGEKPLYYASMNGIFVFASDLRSLQVAPGWDGYLNDSALEYYLRFGCVSGNQSIFRGILKLPPGTTLTVSKEDVDCADSLSPATWWCAVEAAREARQQFFGRPGIEAVESALANSVRQQMFADGSLGGFLSGGVDSSLIVALMQSQTSNKVRTFSVGFGDPRYDESEQAAAVAHYLGTEHTTLKATPEMAVDVVPKLQEIYDEPFADSSQLPTFLLMSLTGEHISVALSGDAGDELFGGYNRHVWLPRVWQKLNRMPLTVRRLLARALKLVPSSGYDKFMVVSGKVLPSRYHIRTFGEKLYKLADVLVSSSDRALYGGLASMNRHPEELLAPEWHSGKPVEHLYPALASFNQVEWMMLMDTLNFMVDDVLVKVERASRACGLEVRAPFLDPGVYAAAWNLPLNMRVHNGQGKWALKQILDRHVPRELIERPKMGFAIPLDDWLRGPLREWAEDLLSTSALNDIPAINRAAVQTMWRSHIRGDGHFAQQLWAVLQLSAWARRWKPVFSKP